MPIGKQTMPTINPTPAQPVKSQAEVELEQAHQTIQQLSDKLYIANLKDDVLFRIELLTAINAMSINIQNLVNIIQQLQGTPQ